MAPHYQDNNDTLTTMSIVLPRRKHIDFLAPSKALQDAKKKLGPIYFDAKLIECPQNAVELSKLVQEWDDIDKKKFKILEETRRNKRILLHTLSSRYKFSKSTTGITTVPSLRDTKLPPPGFRYHSNGQPKLSLVSSELPEFPLSEGQSEDQMIKKTPIPYSRHQAHKESRQFHDVIDASDSLTDLPEYCEGSPSGSETTLSSNEKFVPGESEITIQKSEIAPETHFRIDYEKEIKDLENVIKEINEDLEKNNIDLYENSGSVKGKVYAFLRAHARGDRVSLKQLVEPNEFNRPNDRFAIQPGSSTFRFSTTKSTGNLHKKKTTTRTHGSCIACQCKIKHESSAYVQMKKDIGKSVFKRWNIPPKGKLFESSTTLLSSSSSKRAFSAISLGRKRSSCLNNAISRVKFSETHETYEDKDQEEYPLDIKNKKSSRVLFKTVQSSSDVSFRQQTTSTTNVRQAKSAIDRRAYSSLNVQPSSSSRDQQSLMDFLKADAHNEEKECSRKVEAFVKKMKKLTAPPKPKIAFL